MDRSVHEIFPLDELVFGGSFDPVHNGHLATIAFVLEKQIAHKIRFIPVGVSPFKTENPPAPGLQRLHMLSLAVSNFFSRESLQKIIIDDREIKRGQVSYTFETLRSLRSENPGKRTGFLMGSDSLVFFQKWANPEEILKFHPLIILERGDEDSERIQEISEGFSILFLDSNPVIVSLENPLFPCSSTEIRESLGKGNQGKSLDECLPAAVLDYIRKERLYGFLQNPYE